MTRSVQQLRAAYDAEGYHAPKDAQEARVLRAELMKHPAYFDHKHPDHATLVADVASFFLDDAPPEDE